VEIIEEVGSDNLSLQLDVYHAHIMEGDAVQSIQRNASHIGHVQVADAPGRHEPGTGRIDFPAVFQALDRANYAGWIGCEYVPSGTTEETLTWLPKSRDVESRKWKVESRTCKAKREKQKVAFYFLFSTFHFLLFTYGVRPPAFHEGVELAQPAPEQNGRAAT
jgi:Xylose isomerase-like TIM barrel